MNDHSLDVDTARANILSSLTCVTGNQTVAIRDSLNSILAVDIISPINVPAHDNSAMDGYAIRGSELSSGSETLRLKVIGTSFAGKSWDGECPPGACVRIMTGSVMPADCDTVVVQEQVKVDADHIEFKTTGLRAGDNRRLRGEDLAKGQPALRAGRVIRPADLGLLASLGVAEIPVKQPLRVAFFSTGDELRSLGQSLDEGCVYDSNRYTLFGMLKRLGFVQLIDMGVVKDSPEALEQAMLQAATHADVILTSGGVSVGEADFTKTVMQQLGQVEFWKINMRPGRPMAFGRIRKPQGGQDAVLFGLPGNPVAVMVTFLAFVRDALHTLAGAAVRPLPLISARSTSPIRKKAGRTEYQRARLVERDGELWAELTGAQGSGVLRSMSESDALLVLPHHSGSVQAGETVKAWLFEGLI